MAKPPNLTTAQTAPEILEAATRWLWFEAHSHNTAKRNNCPPSMIPTPEALAEWLPDCPRTIWSNFTTQIDALHFHFAVKPERPTHGITMDDYRAMMELFTFPHYAAPMRRTGDTLARELLGAHRVWAGIDPTIRGRHPAGLLVEAWQNRSRTITEATTTTANGMTRRLELISTIQQRSFTPFDSFDLDATLVDGEPLAARIPDFSDVFPPPKPRRRRKFKPNEKLPLKFPGIGNPYKYGDLRLLALAQVAAEENSIILAGDVLTLLTLAHAIDRDLKLHERQGAALLSRTRDGGFRRPLPADIKRFWRAAQELAYLHVTEPWPGGFRWANLASVQGDPRTRSVTIAPPAWLRSWQRKDGRWTLTAEGGNAAKSRIVAGKSGAGGRLITGIEYRLAARYDGRPGVAPDLRPDWKGGPGPMMFVPWRTAMHYMGDAWNQTDYKADQAALMRWRRMIEKVLEAGYQIPSLHGQAPAGDSVEVVAIVRASKSQTAGLKVRASARFVEAARLANLKDGRGFETVRITDWLPKGLKVGAK